MRRSTALMSLAAVAVMASSAFAQAKPNFAGTWFIVVDSAAQAQAQAAAAGGGGGGGGGRGGRGGGGMGQMFAAAQDDKMLTITRTQGENEIKMVYNLDGSESKNTMPGRGGNPGMEQVSKATWEGNNLVITRSQPMQDGAMTTIRQIWTVDAAGYLWLETQRDGQAMGAKLKYRKGVPISK